jgi:hypothetical protein
MNAIVNDYQTISDDRIASLVLVEAIFLGVSCVVFLLELLFVVPQILKALRKAGRELKDESDSAEKFARVKKYSKMKKGMCDALILKPLLSTSYRLFRLL